MRRAYLSPGSLLVGLLLFGVNVLGADNDRRLIDALRARDAETARQLLGKVDPNVPQGDGTTALHWAVHWNDVDLAKGLIRAGAKVNVANDNGVTPLWLACVNGSGSMADLLLAAGANPNTALLTGETPLMTAARTGSLDAVNLLLARGADVNAHESAQHQTALMWAIAGRHAAVAKRLIQQGAEIEARTKSGGGTRSLLGGSVPLHFAARMDDVESTQALLTAGANVDSPSADGSTPLLVATLRGNLEVAQVLLKHGADPNLPGPGYTPLHWVAGSWETKLTGAAGPQIGRDEDWWPLGGLRGEKKLDFIRALLAHGANPNARLVQEPPRVGLSLYGLTWKQAFFGPNMGPLDLTDATPFLFSAWSADVAAMRLLVAAGADPQLTTKDHTTALMLAAGVGRVLADSFVTDEAALEAVKLMLELGNDIHAANAAGQTPLHGAAFLRSNKVVQFLVDHDAFIHAKNARGQTPLVVSELNYGGTSVVVNHSATGDLLRKLGGE